MNFKPAAPVARRLSLAIVIALSFPLCVPAAGTGLPTYPAAHKQTIKSGARMSITSGCGHTFTMEGSYTVDADPHAIAKWYESKMPGSRTIDLMEGDAGAGGAAQMTSLEVMAADGSSEVVVNRMNFSSAQFAAAGKAIGMDKADIGIESVTPPLGARYVALEVQMGAGGAAAKKAAEQLKATCKG